MTLTDTLSTLSASDIRRLGVSFNSGPFVVRVKTDSAELVGQLLRCYPDTPSVPGPQIVHFDIQVLRQRGLRRWVNPQVVLHHAGKKPFQPFPASHAYPLFEWGLNWATAIRAHRFLMLHSAALERDGQALLLPAIPGSGKSTLCSALTFRGWRLLSDEFGLVDRTSGAVHPLPRSIPLKNVSIDVIRRFAPQAELGPIYKKTRKGDVSHLKPDRQAVVRQRETAQPRWILFPRFRAGSPVVLKPLDKGVAFTRLSQNAFNYRLLGAEGFRHLTGLVKGCDCYALQFGDLDEAIARIEELLRRQDDLDGALQP